MTERVENETGEGRPPGRGDVVIRLTDWLFRDRRTGRITIAQVPNPALLVFLTGAVVARLTRPSTLADAASTVGRVALAVWAVDEIVRGVNPWRRLLGAGVLGGLVVGLLNG